MLPRLIVVGEPITGKIVLYQIDLYIIMIKPYYNRAVANSQMNKITITTEPQLAILIIVEI